MQFIIFALVYPIIWLFSILPFRILYFISDGFYYLIYYVIGYRKKVVTYNLKLVFPDKSDQEIKKISKKFYRHFIDIFIEMIKAFTISEKEILKRYTFTNIELIHSLESDANSMVLIGSHYANWEWIFSLNLSMDFKGYAVYKRIKNRFFDKEIRHTRGRYHTLLVPTKEIFKVVAGNTENNILSIYGFLGDQSPNINKQRHWSKFLGVKVPVHTGVETLAKKYNLSVVAFNTRKIKRGYYETTFKMLAKDPNDFEDFNITEKYLSELEKSVYHQPEYYMWTHKRFKHKNNENGK